MDTQKLLGFVRGDVYALRASVRAGEFKVATWLRKVSLQVARGELVPAEKRARR